jgi:hypothetical protein
MFLLLLAGCQATKTSVETEALYLPEEDESTRISVVLKIESLNPVCYPE